MKGKTGKSTDFMSVYGIFEYLVPAFFVLGMLFLLYDQSASDTVNAAMSQFLITFSLTSCVGASVYMFYRGQLKTGAAVGLIIVCAFFVKLAYAIKIPYTDFQHDVESINSSGHLSYIYTLATKWQLPQSNIWQFCHPPLHHFLAALVYKLGEFFRFSQERCFESIQYLTVFYSTCTTVWFYKILKQIGVKGRALVYSLIIFAFHPTFTILAGSINNDMLTIMLCTGAIYYLLKWCEQPKWRYVFMLGVLCGLGMMTKFSAVITVGVVCLTALVKFIREKCNKLYLAQAPVYAVITAVLGGWYQLRNYVLFGQPLGYVAQIPVESMLYTGDESILYRFFVPPLNELSRLFCDPFKDCNIWLYTLKCSVFGEYSWTNAGVALLLLFVNFIFIAASIAAFVRLLIAKEKVGFLTAFVLIANFAVTFLSFIVFYIRYPFGCSMDFRYVVPSLISSVACLAIYASRLQKLSSKSNNAHALMSLYASAAIVFAMLGTLLFV